MPGMARRSAPLLGVGIHPSDIPASPYAILWGERSIRSVANPARRSRLEFLELAPGVPIRTEIQPFPLAR